MNLPKKPLAKYLMLIIYEFLQTSSILFFISLEFHIFFLLKFFVFDLKLKIFLALLIIFRNMTSDAKYEKGLFFLTFSHLLPTEKKTSAFLDNVL